MPYLNEPLKIIAKNATLCSGFDGYHRNMPRRVSMGSPPGPPDKIY